MNLAAALTVTAFWASVEDIRVSVVICRGTCLIRPQSHPRQTLASLDFREEDESLEKQDGQRRVLVGGPLIPDAHRIWVVFDAVCAPRALHSHRMEQDEWGDEIQLMTGVEGPNYRIVLLGAVMRSSLQVTERLPVMEMAAVLDMAFHRPMKEEDKIRREAVVIVGEPGFDTTACWLLVVVRQCKHSEVERCGLEAVS